MKQTQRIVGGLAALVVVLVGVWFFWLRGGGDETKRDATGEHGRSADIKPIAGSAAPEPAARPRGDAPRWSIDLDVEGPLRLEGQVVNADMKGVAAEVWISTAPPRSVKTEDDGTFVFDKLVGRTYSLTARSAELIGELTYKLHDKPDPAVIHLSEGAGLEVSVQDDGKQPIANAEVKLTALGEPKGKTDDKGKATIKPVHPGWLAVEVSATGYAANGGFTTIGSAGATAKLSITLHKGVSVSGRVVDETGKPIGKAHVSGSDSGSWGWSREADAAITDDKGQFVIATLAPGAHSLHASDGEHAAAHTPPITVADRPITGIEIQMKVGGSITGTVVDRETKPVPFATVRVAGSGAQMWAQPRQVTTDKTGAFELRGLARGKHQARAESDAAASAVVDVDLTTEGNKKDLKLVLDVGGVIAGIVVDETGQPVPEIEVHAFPDITSGGSMQGFALAGMSATATAGDGTFTIRGLPDGSYRLSAARNGKGFRDWGQQGTQAKVGDKSVKITLAAPGMLVGKLALDGQSAPPKLATVQLGGQATTPIVDGAFVVKDLAPGSYDVTFRGVEFAELVRHDVKIEANKPTDLGTVTVVRGRKLLGKVVDAGGSPVANAKIKVGDMLFSLSGADDQAASFDEMSGIKSTLTDQSGDFMLVGIPQKATNVAADHPDKGRSIAVPVIEGTDDPPPITLTLRGFGSIVGTVTMKGAPQGEVTISDASKGGGAQAMFARTADDGTYTLAKVPEGPHVLSAMQSQGLGMSMKSTSVTVTVVAGKQTLANIDIPVGSVTLTVTIKALPGNQVDAAQVFLLAGTVTNVSNAKQLMDGFLGGSVKGVKIWFGEGKPFPEFDELVPDSYSVCAIPVTGNFMDPTFQQRVGKNTSLLKVYCKPVTITPSPAQQTLTEELPSMTPLPPPT